MFLNEIFTLGYSREMGTLGLTPYYSLMEEIDNLMLNDNPTDDELDAIHAKFVETVERNIPDYKFVRVAELFAPHLIAFKWWTGRESIPLQDIGGIQSSHMNPLLDSLDEMVRAKKKARDATNKAIKESGTNKTDFDAYVKSLEWVEYIRAQRAEFHLYINTICRLKDLSGTNPTKLLNTLSMYNIRDDEFEMKYQQYCLGLTPRTLSAPDTDKRWNRNRDAYSGLTYIWERAMRHHCTPPAELSESVYVTEFYDIIGKEESVASYIDKGWDCRLLLPSIYSMYYGHNIMTTEEWLETLNARRQSNITMLIGGAKEDTTFAPKPKERKQFDLIKELDDIDMPDNVNFINNYFDEINKVRDNIQKEPENELEKVKKIYTTVVINILNNLHF